MTQSIGDRMKNNYENRSRSFLTRRTPVIMRLDGKCFHTLLRDFDKPFDEEVSRAMVVSALTLVKQMQGVKCAYIQSDEVSILITDFDSLNTEAWFNYNVQKMTSVAAAIMSVRFSDYIQKNAYFDCRVFNIPKEEVVNYFVWRQKDWERNSLQMLALAHFSHRQLDNKKASDIHEMLHTKEINWADLDDKWKNGVFMHVDEDNKFFERPSFRFTDSVARHYIEEVLMAQEE